MPGCRSDLEGFRLHFRPSLLALHAQLQSAKVSAVEPEKDLEAETSLGLLYGSADLMLSFAGHRDAVIDMKWAGGRKYRTVLAEGAHLQLAVYAHLQKEASGRWPAVGYYILREGELLTPAEGLFPGARVVPQEEGATAALWEKAKATYRWRRGQIDQGWVEVVAAGTEPTDESAPPSDGMVLEVLDDRYNPYAHLVGWAAGR